MSRKDGNVAIAGPLHLKGSAVERDDRVKERNNAPRPLEDQWIANLDAQDAEMAESEMGFFAELKQRAKDAI